jgi:putative transposase
VLVLEYKVKGKQYQYNAIDDAIRTTQFIRNKSIRYWMDSPRELKIDKFALNKYSTELRNEFKFVSDLNSMAVQASAERAWLSIARFYDNCKNKLTGKKGFPKFQKDNRSVEYKTSGWKLQESKRRITFTDKKGIGELKLLGKWDIHQYDQKLIKRVRIVRKSNNYFVQFCVAVNVEKESRISDGEIGLDVGLEYFYSDSNGNHEENPRFLRKAENDVKRVQRKIFTKKKGSINRRKARSRYSAKHLRISNQRKEHAKRLARNVCKANALIAYENLNVKGMVKNHKLAKSISDASWSSFLRWIDYFADKFESIAIAVPPHYTSQKCSCCGTFVKKSLSTRTHRCNSCGTVLQRDVNAAINILNLAKARDGQSRSNASGVETSISVGENLPKQVLTLNEESPRL